MFCSVGEQSLPRFQKEKELFSEAHNNFISYQQVALNAEVY